MDQSTSSIMDQSTSSIMDQSTDSIMDQSTDSNQTSSLSLMAEIRKRDFFQFLFAGARLETFRNWTFDNIKNATCTSINLAKAGFVMLSTDQTSCPFCGECLEWEHAMENPSFEHRQLAPTCEFVNLMDKEEAEWTISDSIPLLASLAAQLRVSHLEEAIRECKLNFSKVEGHLIPYLPDCTTNEK